MGEEARGPPPCQGGVRVTGVRVRVCVCVGERATWVPGGGWHGRRLY